ncbi:hypothetical protein PVAND_016298 [Polypedilum vanderplanki]|uniref:Uncharacterized protein n=1 Tax=Polypedilum vanderplanki TaxID=319348 RepID=A0A9J6BF18_POLVA|nr:hypothetical protein PVAND_016298 [Polypedilum vanderplanki]
MMRKFEKLSLKKPSLQHDGDLVPFEDYVEDNVVFYSGLHAHYVTILKKNDGFLLIDSHPVYRCIFYYDILVLLNDLEELREIGSFTMHHVKRYEKNASNVIDLMSNSDEEKEIKTIDFVSDYSDAKNESVDVDQEENESGQEVGKYHPDAIWASSIEKKNRFFR